jgi:hydrogenase maturation protease
MQGGTRDRVLVAGIGNIFFGDDGFGVEVANRLLQRPVPRGVKVVDFGIRGVHLAYELLDGYDVLVLIDALPIGDAPGTVALIEPELPEPPDPGDDVAPTVDAHSMSPALVLGMLAGLGGSVDQIYVVGCQPETIEERIGLSEPVAAAVEPAVDLVDEVLADLCAAAGRRP